MSGVYPGVGLLQVSERMICQCDDTPDNASLFLIAFASKSQSSADTSYRSIKREAPSTLQKLHFITTASPMKSK